MGNNFRFVIGTHSFLTVATVGKEMKLLDLQVLAQGHHYGIALPVNDGTQFIAKGGKMGDGFTTYQASISHDAGPNYFPTDRVSLGNDFKSVHQVSYYKGGLYVANTEFNDVAFVLLDGSVQTKYSFEGKNEDINHINSVMAFNQNQLICLLHNHGNGPSEVAFMKHASPYCIELVNRAPLWHRGCHNVFLDEENLAYNASGKGLFVVVDIKTQRIKRCIEFPGHTKGLSVIDDYFVIGYSDHAEREKRKLSNGYLVFIDRSTLEVAAEINLNHISLPHAIGNVNEIRCLSHQDSSQYISNIPDLFGPAFRLSNLSSY